jgi:hypothetical protein
MKTYKWKNPETLDAEHERFIIKKEIGSLVIINSTTNDFTITVKRNDIIKSDYFENPETNEDYIQIAIDYYGSSIRDNSQPQKIELGKQYHTNGDTEE